MASKLADLVLPDSTPVNQLPEEAEEAGRAKRPEKSGNIASRIRAPRTGDILFAACGVSLAAICAVFPWYIFFNQEQFGIRPLTFSGDRQGQNGLDPEARSAIAGRLAENTQLDFIPTGAVPEEGTETRNIPEQPFPGNRLSFSLVHAANGRAMIEDESGFWLVERGSHLPDGSYVAEIMRRDGTWVLVTSEERELALSN